MKKITIVSLLILLLTNLSAFGAAMSSREAQELARAIEESKKSISEAQSKRDQEYQRQLQRALEESKREEDQKRQLERDINRAISASQQDQLSIDNNTHTLAVYLRIKNLVCRAADTISPNLSNVDNYIAQLLKEKINLNSKIDLLISRPEPDRLAFGLFTGQRLIQEKLDFINAGVELKDLTIIKALIAKGAKIEKGTLHRAIIKAEPAIVEFLLKNNAAINEQDSDQNTPMHVAIANFESSQVDTKKDKLFQIIQILFKANADTNIVNREGKIAAELTQDPLLDSLFVDKIAREKRALREQTKVALVPILPMATPLLKLICEYAISLA